MPSVNDKFNCISIVIRNHILTAYEKDKTGELTTSKYKWIDESNFDTLSFSTFLLSTICFCCVDSHSTDTIPPDPYTISTFLKKALAEADMKVDMLFLVLVILQKLLNCKNLPDFALVPQCWRPTIIGSIILAGKIWGDDSIEFQNSDFIEILDISLAQLNKIEVKMLEALEWNLTVDATVYADTYFVI